MAGQGHGSQPERLARSHQTGPEALELLGRLVEVGTHLGVGLDLAAIELGNDQLAQLRAGRIQQIGSPRDKITRAGIDNQQLFLDAERGRHCETLAPQNKQDEQDDKDKDDDTTTDIHRWSIAAGGRSQTSGPGKQARS
jgi:hypothetical protein